MASWTTLLGRTCSRLQTLQLLLLEPQNGPVTLTNAVTAAARATERSCNNVSIVVTAAARAT